MKLYYCPGTCSLAVHIALLEAGIPFTMEAVDLRKMPRMTEGGIAFATVNSKDYVPALILDNDQVLTECSAILQYIADLVPDKDLAPRNGTFEHYRLQEWLGFIATEIHKGFIPLWLPQTPDTTKRQTLVRLDKWFAWISQQLNGKNYLLANYTIADAYLFTCLCWAKPLNIPLEAHPILQAYHARIAARPAVLQAIKDERLQ